MDQRKPIPFGVTKATLLLIRHHDVIIVVARGLLGVRRWLMYFALLSFLIPQSMMVSLDMVREGRREKQMKRKISEKKKEGIIRTDSLRRD